jgi:hypothetical protein
MGATIISKLTSPPTVEQITARLSARLALPDCRIGYPSSAVAAADGMPGTPMRMADTEPPVMPPM